MEKRTLGRGSYWSQIAGAIVVGLGILLAWPFDKVGAAPIVRILPPNEVLNERQTSLTTHSVSHRSDAAFHLDANDLKHNRRKFDAQRLDTQLTRAKRSERQIIALRPDNRARVIEERNTLEKNREETGRGNANVFNLNAHENRTSGSKTIRPIISERYRSYDASRSHSLIEFNLLQLERSRSYSVRIGSFFIGIPCHLNSILCGFDGFFGSKDPFSRETSASVYIEQSQHEQQYIDEGEPKVDVSVKRRLFGPLGGLPLSAQITIAILLTICAWPLNRTLQRLVDKSIDTDGPFAIRYTFYGFVCGYVWVGATGYTWACATWGWI